MNLSKASRYKVAAYIIFLSILFDILSLVSILDAQILRLIILLSVPLTFLYAYAHLTFKEMLNKQFHYFDADKIIYMQIAFSVITTILGLFISIAYILSLPVLGILLFLLGKKLEVLTDNLYGYKTKFTKTAKYGGILVASMILSLIGIIINMLNSYYMGRILLGASRNSSQPMSSSVPSDIPQTT